MEENKIKGVWGKLHKVQQALHCGKSQSAKYGDRVAYTYRNCEDILEAAKPHLAEVKAVILLDNEIQQVGDRWYVKAIAKFVDVETGESVEVSAQAREEETKKQMDGSQITGASSSYARKYALGGLLAIDDGKDSDTTNRGDNGATAEQVKEINELGVNVANVFKRYGVTILEDLTYEQAAFVINSKKKSIAAEQQNG